MGRRKGFFAELQHQARQHERESARRARASEKQHQTAIREADRQRRAEEKARAQMLRASAAERKEREREAKLAHISAMEAEVVRRNAEIQAIEDELANILAGTLDVDDHVDLETLRVDPTPPPFARSDLECVVPEPPAVPDPPRPELILPGPPKGLFAILFAGKHRRTVRAAQQAHERAIAVWHGKTDAAQAMKRQRLAEHSRAEASRLDALARAREDHAKESARFVSVAAARNTELDQLIANLAYGVPEAVDEYISIVLANSVYPDCFTVRHEFAYDSKSAELALTVLIPAPGDLPKVKSYKYNKTADEIESREMTRKEQKDRYCSVVNQTTLRSVHEIFEADRRSLIKTISLVVATDTIDPSTGNDARIAFVAFATQRVRFDEINLRRVDADVALRNLGASVSKNPLELQPVDTSGVRRVS